MRAKVVSFVFAALVAAIGLPIRAQSQDPMSPAAPPAPPQRRLDLTFDGAGNVTLNAQNVTVREILAEWARKGGSQITGGERLAGGPITRQFVNKSEVDVLAALLRSASGYGLLPKMEGTAGPSRVNVLIVATSSPTSMYSGTPASGVTAPAVTTPGSPDDEIPPVVPPGVNAPGQAGAPPPPPQNRPATTGVVVPVVPVVAVPGSTTAPPTPPGTTGRGGGGGGR